jgi:hypothetical protein
MGWKDLYRKLGMMPRGKKEVTGSTVKNALERVFYERKRGYICGRSVGSIGRWFNDGKAEASAGRSVMRHYLAGYV